MNCEITVLMSVYKESSEYLIASIESILNQSFSCFEFIIILDNPANDDAKRLIESYEKKDNRIRFFINEENLGLALSLNFGIKKAKSPYIARMDADDIAKTDRLQKQILFLEKHSNIDFVSTNKNYIDEFGNIIKKGDILPENDGLIKKSLEYVNVILHSGVMCRTSAMAQLNGYRLLVPAEDYDLWLRAVDKGLKFGVINEPLMLYRTNPKSISNQNALIQFNTARYVIKLHKERQKKNLDSFSNDAFLFFLEKTHSFDGRKQVHFAKYLKCYQESLVFKENKKWFKFLFFFVKSLICSSNIRKMFFQALRYKLIIKKGNR